MSIEEVSTDVQPKGRKRDAEAAELEVDINAPEPPSKKALRKAKKAKVSGDSQSATQDKPVSKSTAAEDDTNGDIKRSDYGIWIGNLLFNTTKEELIRFLTSSSSKIAIRPSEITRVHLPLGPPKFGKLQNKGFAYIDFSDQASLDMALQLSESVLGGRPVLIKNAKSFAGRPEQKKEQVQKHPPSRKIFVGNLDFSTTKEDLEAHFAVCGTVSHVHMATFEDSGKCKGFAWVEFEEISSAEKATRGWVEAGDKSRADSKDSRSRTWVNTIQGRRLRMEYAEDKAVRYEKRYGKNAKKTVAEGAPDAADGIVEVAGNEDATPYKQRRKPRKPKAPGKYSEETVQRLTGAMVEAKGERKVFD